MTKQVQRRRGTATQHTSFTGAEGELSVNTTNKSVHVHDNVTAGGFEAARVDMDNVTSSSILTAAGITATTAELNYVDGVTSNIQTQLDGKAGTASPTFTGTLTTANLTATGTTTLAGASTSADITFGDNDKAIFGAGSDLQIYHDGTHSRVDDTGTGKLILRGNDAVEIHKYTGEYMITAAADGAVTLYHDDSPKLATSSSGVDITGTLTSDVIQSSSTGSASAPAYSFDGHTTAGFYRPSGLGSSIGVSTSGAQRALFSNNGDISFYEDTGTTPKFFWDASAESLGIGTSSPSMALDVAGACSTGGQTGAYVLQTLYDTTAFALGVGGGIGFAGNAGPSTSDVTFATINGIKENSTTGNYSGALTFKTRVSGAALTEAMRIDSSGNVGINTSSAVPLDANAQLLAIHGDAVGAERAQIKLTTTTSGQAAGDGFYIAVDDSAAYISQRENQPLVFLTNATERMRILADGSCRWTPDGTNPDMTLDASGNLLVGKTTTALADVGHNFNPSGFSFHTRSGGEVLYLNRKGSGGTESGDIIKFYSNSSEVGSIGTFADRPYFTGTVGIGLSNDDLRPTSDSGANNDASVDLGHSTVRWRNLYLSGGVVFDAVAGNATSNTLDDYEEGTWTPIVVRSASDPTVTYADQTGTYTKVGNMVTLWCDIRISTISGGSGLDGVGGFPFTIGSSGANRANHAIMVDKMTSDSRQVTIQSNTSSTYALLIQDSGTTLTHSGLTGSLTAGSHLRFCIKYTV